MEKSEWSGYWLRRLSVNEGTKWAFFPKSLSARKLGLLVKIECEFRNRQTNRTLKETNRASDKKSSSDKFQLASNSSLPVQSTNGKLQKVKEGPPIQYIVLYIFLLYRDWRCRQLESGGPLLGLWWEYVDQGHSPFM